MSAPPEQPSIDIRFVTGSDWLSRLIRLQAGVSMPFTPSHTEALSKDGKWYIGAHWKGGILKRPVGYDADSLITLKDGSKSERIVRIACTQAQEDAFYRFVESHLGEPYDWKAIFGFVLPWHLHIVWHRICSAFMSAALRADGVEVFRHPLSKPFHRISPDMLFLILSSHVEIDH